MIKVISYDCHDLVGREFFYEFKLENGDTIEILESNYDRIMLHDSTQGKRYKAIVNENEDRDDLPIEYIGFELIE
jgi:hypothetical protein